MNEKKKRIPVILVAVLVIMAAMLLICSCKKADSSRESAEIKTEKTEERYEIIAMISEGEEATAEDLALQRRNITVESISSDPAFFRRHRLDPRLALRYR